MNRNKKLAIAGLCVFVVAIGLKLLATSLPVKIEGSAWDSIEKCAVHQKYLYQSIEHYRQEKGKLPDQDFQIHGSPARNRWKCPASESGYALHLENYGNPSAVVLNDKQHRHPTTLNWWLKGLAPQIQTMGDGSIHFFKGGKLLNMNGSEKRK